MTRASLIVTLWGSHSHNRISLRPQTVIGGDKSQHISSEEAGYRRNSGPAFPSGISPKGTTDKDLLPRRHEVFSSDYEWVQRVRGRLLRLEANDSPSKSQIDQSSCFRLRTVASEMELPEVVAEHWLESLREDSILVECPPDQFTAPDDWIPLYTRAGLQHYLLAALSAFQNQGVPSLIAVAPPDFHVSSNKEFLLSVMHCLTRHVCLVRQSFNI